MASSPDGICIITGSRQTADLAETLVYLALVMALFVTYGLIVDVVTRAPYGIATIIRQAALGSDDLFALKIVGYFAIPFLLAGPLRFRKAAAMSALRGPGRIAGLWLLAAGVLGACTTPAPVPPVTPPVVAAPQCLDAQTVRLYLPPSVRTVGQAAEIAADPVSPLAYARPSELTSKTRALLLVLGGAGRVIIDDRLRLVTFDEEAG